MGCNFESWKQVVVFQMDVLNQVLCQSGCSGIQRLPGIAGPTRGGVLRGQDGQSLQLGSMVDVFMTHHADGVFGHGVSPFFEQGEQNGFFFGHVLQKLILHGFQLIGQTLRYMRVLTVYGLYPASHANQFRQLLTMHLVKALKDMVNQFGRRRGWGQRFGVIQGANLSQHLRGIQTFFSACIFKGLLASATKIQFQFSKDGGCPWDTDGQFA